VVTTTPDGVYRLGLLHPPHSPVRPAQAPRNLHLWISRNPGMRAHSLYQGGESGIGGVGNKKVTSKCHTPVP
jgi:hypothetical protein